MKVADGAWIGVGGLSFVGLSVNEWVVVTALAFGVFRALNEVINLIRNARKGV